jgi:hypothetical protein
VQEKKRSVKDIVEFRILPILAVIVLFAAALRSGSAWSEGTFNLNLLPGFLVHIIDAVIGLSLAGLMEIVMTLAGSKWLAHKEEAIRAEFDAGLPLVERKVQAAQHKAKGRIAFWFSALGGVCSIIGAMYFGLTNPGNHSSISVAIDLVTAILITVCVFYVFVLHEPIKEDVTREVQGDMLVSLKSILKGIGERIKNNEHDNRDIRTLQKALPHSQKRILDALIRQEMDETMWDVATIAQKLGMDNDTGKRTIRRAIARAKDDVTYGIVDKESGRGYELPMSQAVRLFEKEFERRIANGSERTTTGQQIATSPEIFEVGQVGNGH